jgi:hypothetical protein
VDDRAERSAGWKFAHWEMKGVPLRLDLGARELREGLAPVRTHRRLIEALWTPALLPVAGQWRARRTNQHTHLLRRHARAHAHARAHRGVGGAVLPRHGSAGGAYGRAEERGGGACAHGTPPDIGRGHTRNTRPCVLAAQLRRRDGHPVVGLLPLPPVRH